MAFSPTTKGADGAEVHGRVDAGKLDNRTTSSTVDNGDGRNRRQQQQQQQQNNHVAAKMTSWAVARLPPQAVAVYERLAKHEYLEQLQSVM